MNRLFKVLFSKDKAPTEHLEAVQQSRREMQGAANRLFETIDRLIERNDEVTKRKTRNHVQRPNT